MAKRRKRARWDDNSWDEPERAGRRSKRRRRFEREDSPVAVADPAKRPPAPITCHQCGHLVITRSFVKHVSQSWDHAVVFPTYTCFQQCWTLEDPDSVDDKASVTEYLVGGADRCPSFSRGYPRGHDWL